MNTKTADLICLLMIITVSVFTVVMYSILPAQIPVHWNAAGEIDDYAGKAFAFMFPTIAAATWLLMLFVRRFSPKGYRVDSFIRTVSIFQVASVALAAALTVVFLLAANGQPIDMVTITGVGSGLLAFVLGNFMGRVRPNFFIGIRTPWTLASEEVWTRTHRLGAWMLTAAGVFMVITSLAGLPLMLSLMALTVAGVGPAIYSFVIYRRLEGFA